MAQAVGISTAIRQLMSRGRPPKSTSPVRLAHTELIASLACNVPHPIYAGADPDDLDTRADHLEKLFGALHAYPRRPRWRHGSEHPGWRGLIVVSSTTSSMTYRLTQWG
jgi:hypothetical protein